ncbi:MAG: calcium/sodium antiporter [Verrucomicrobiales bacterium]|nr:calcium/sodium antiporter [Verrucomicrobiales bacterium]
MFSEILFLLLGLTILTVGAEFLVRGATSIALRLGLSEILVGLTVVAFGTSAPELAVSIKAALGGQGTIAVGNIVGSNIFNIGVILGLAALVCPLVVHLGVVRKDMPLVIGFSLIFILFLFTGSGIARWEGVLLFLLLTGYLGWSFYAGKREAAGADLIPTVNTGGSMTGSISFVVGGLVMLVFGARLFVDGAVGFARGLGWSEAVIGLTIVSAGTSMPELATSIVASLKRQTDIAIGNVVGSNIFNLLCIGGITATIHPLSPGGIGWIDLGVMLGTSLILIPFMRSGFRLNRWEGGVLLAIYTCYLWVLWP